MKYLQRIASFLTLGIPAVATGNTFLMNGRGEPSRFDARWDEALMAAEFDETARRFLDFMGPRGK